MINLSKEEKTAILEDILPTIEKEDSSKRSTMVRLWRQMESYWDGIQSLYWDEYAHDWRNIGDVGDEGSEREGGAPIYDYVVNIMKPHGQAIISAVSQKVPFPEYVPADANKVEDVLAARAKTKLSVILQKRNDFKLLMMDALFKKFNQGVSFWYNYYERDKKYGEYDRVVLEAKEEDVDHNVCPDCGEEDAYDNGRCIRCFTELPPKVESRKEHVTHTSTERASKGRTRYLIYGPLNVRIPFYVKSIADKDCGYLLLYEDLHISYLKELFKDVPGLPEKIVPTDVSDETGRWGRDAAYYYTYPTGAEMNNLTTSKKLWVRTWMFNSIKDEKVRNSLKEKFPNDDFYACIVAKEIADCAIDRMDDRWTCGKSDLSTFVHSNPTGRPLLPMQDAKNTVFNLTIQTIENGIPSMWVDPQYVDLDKFQQGEASPGLYYPLKSDLRPNDNVASHFFETGRSSLSREIDLFDSKLDTSAQFTVGSYPSIYGGPSTGRSRTLGEYQQSRAMALQRLGILWDFTKREIIEATDKGIKETIVNLDWDEEHVTFKEGDSFKNIQAHQSELRSGETGDILIQSDEDFPISISQKRELFLQLIEMSANIPMLGEILNHPNNLPSVTQVLGSPEIYIPGDDQKIKQLEEIAELSKSGPVSQTEPSVPIDPPLDDSQVHANVLRAFLVSPEGTALKEQNPEGFNNCKLHLLQHLQDIEQKMMMQSEGTPPGTPHKTR